MEGSHVGSPDGYTAKDRILRHVNGDERESHEGGRG